MCVVAMLVACRQHPFCKVADRASGRAGDPERARSVTAEWDKVEIEWMGIVLRAGRQERRAEREGEEGGLADVRPSGRICPKQTYFCLRGPSTHCTHTGFRMRAVILAQF